jgi:hypothetical protein
MGKGQQWGEMLETAEEDRGSEQRWQWWTTTVVDMTAGDDNGLRDRVADYEGEGQERAARDGGDSGVAIMAEAKMVGVATEDSNGGR